MAICQNIDLFLDENGAATLNPENIDNGSSDNCSSTLTYNASQTNFTCADLGSQTVVLTVEDGCGNVSTCNAMVTIIDNINPTLMCVCLLYTSDAADE